jgi:glycosyltransferase involved in cell wall biosynthesis
MRLAYISPSILPSRSANSIHVLQQCLALQEAGVDVTLFAKRRSWKGNDLPAEIGRAYGVETRGLTLRTVLTPWDRGNNIAIAVFACLAVMTGGRYDAVLSRNLFASFILAFVWRKPLIVETHQLETGLRGRMQRMICRSKRVSMVAISQRLAADLREAAGDSEMAIHILHDAAPVSPALPSDRQRYQWREELVPDARERSRFICGYVGHLYPGRGIEIIEGLARRLPDVLFLVVGGNDADIARKKRDAGHPNLLLLGHVPHSVARRAMSAVDLLLMPYQEKVSIGVDGHDTGRWMSPMKMFEYMSSGTAFVASDLPVLREILRDGENAALVAASDLDAWEQKVAGLRNDAARRQALAVRAYQEYQQDHTWRRRAERIVALLET